MKKIVILTEKELQEIEYVRVQLCEYNYLRFSSLTNKLYKIVYKKDH